MDTSGGRRISAMGGLTIFPSLTDTFLTEDSCSWLHSNIPSVKLTLWVWTHVNTEAVLKLMR